MLILESEQVQYCQVVANIEGQLKTESGLVYQKNVFLKEKTYSKEDLQIAIKECREDYLDNKNIEVPLLLIKEKNQVTLWLEDNRFKPEQGDSPSLSPQQEQKSLEQVQVKSSDKINIKNLIAKMRGEDGLEIKTRRYQLKLYKRCFVGSEAVDWLVNYLKISRTQAVAIGKKLVHKKVIHHVTDEHSFKDENLFYRFYEDEGKSIWTDKFL